jgi:hypothetical protein
MVIRGQNVTQDDVLYALTIWKFYGVYIIARFSIRTEREVRRCLWISLFAGAAVAGIAILQSLHAPGITRFLSTYYAPYGNTRAIVNSRGGSTLSLPIAVADLLSFDLAIAVGFMVRERTNRLVLMGVSALFLAGVLSSGEFSGVLGLVLAAIVMAFVTRRVKPFLSFIPAALGAAILLRPVIERRLSGFQSASGLPTSWAGRINNLTTYFWPQLFSGLHFLLGIRPSARVATPTMATGYIWIESGYTWLLWAGGLPFLAAFIYFVGLNVRRTWANARSRPDAIGVASLALVVALIVVAVLMVLDPHLTYRGSADLLFVLLAMTAVGARAAARPNATGAA